SSSPPLEPVSFLQTGVSAGGHRMDPDRSPRALVELDAGANAGHGDRLRRLLGSVRVEHRAQREAAPGADRPEALEAEYFPIGVDPEDARRIGDQGCDLRRLVGIVLFLLRVQ